MAPDRQESINAMRILIVEDSKVLRDSLGQGLREAGYAVDSVADGKRALIHLQTTDYDVVVLDWMLPEVDGLAVLSQMRSSGNNAAVLMLTAKDTVDDRVLGLTRGADDYLVKPFAFKECLARIGALVRRRHGQASPVMPNWDHSRLIVRKKAASVSGSSPLVLPAPRVRPA